MLDRTILQQRTICNNEEETISNVKVINDNDTRDELSVDVQQKTNSFDTVLTNEKEDTIGTSQFIVLFMVMCWIFTNTFIFHIFLYLSRSQDSTYKK